VEDVSILVSRDGSSIGKDGSIVDGVVDKILGVLDSSIDDESSAVINLGCKESSILDEECGTCLDSGIDLSEDISELGQSTFDGQGSVGQDLSSGDDDLIGSSVQSSGDLVQDESSIILDLGSEELRSLDDKLSLSLDSGIGSGNGSFKSKHSLGDE